MWDFAIDVKCFALSNVFLTPLRKFEIKDNDCVLQGSTISEQSFVVYTNNWVTRSLP